MLWTPGAIQAAPTHSTARSRSHMQEALRSQLRCHLLGRSPSGTPTNHYVQTMTMPPRVKDQGCPTLL